MEGTTSCAATVMDATEVGQFLDAEIARDIDLVVFLDSEADDAVDLFWRKPRITYGRITAFHGQSQCL